MPLNITTIINELNARISAAESSGDLSTLTQLIKAIENNDQYGTSTVNFRSDLPSASKSTVGTVYYVRDPMFDSHGSFYVGQDSSSFIKVNMYTDNLEDSDYINSGLGGEPIIPPYGGTAYGYLSNGFPEPTNAGAIRKFSFTSDGNATNVGSFAKWRGNGVDGHSSSTTGYTGGGQSLPGQNDSLNTRDKFPFATDTGSTTTATLTSVGFWLASSHSATHGYTHGGQKYGSPTPRGATYEKFAFATEAAASLGGIIQSSYPTDRYQTVGLTDRSAGYGHVVGDGTTGPSSQLHDKYPHTSDGSSVLLSSSFAGGRLGAGQSSAENGYYSGGYNPSSTILSSIQKLPFAAETSWSSIGNLTVGRVYTTGVSSTTYGYTMGGSPLQNTIDKFSFSSDGNATDVGDLPGTTAFSNSGQQI